MDYRKILEAIPDYKRYLTVDELNYSTEELAEQYPDIVEVLDIGSSRKGEPLRTLKIGEGEIAALLVGCPHPNEPIGALTVDYLAEQLVKNDELRAQLGYTWYLIKCIDPDSTRLNEGWFSGPFSLKHYALNYYRPPHYQQMQWSFPIKYKTLTFDQPIPETRALMRLMEEKRPVFLCTFHNTTFSGVHFYLSEPCPPVYSPLQSLAKEYGLPMTLGAARMPRAVRLADGIFRSGSVRDFYEHYARYAEDPALMVEGGADCWEYAEHIGVDLTLTTEVPISCNPLVGDTTPSNVTRRDSILGSIDIDERLHGLLASKYQEIEMLLSVPSPFKTPVQETIKRTPERLAVKRRSAEVASEFDRVATVAEEFDNRTQGKLHRLLDFGQFVRMIDAQLAAEKDSTKASRLNQCKGEVLRHLAKLSEELERELEYKTVPIKDLVSVQLGAALCVAAQLQTRDLPCNKL